ncbi:universal stress protein [Hymenobacter elongatus]|uniref:Universal stress protein n=1 Tax=Hymenobacter elongatus TaxID=877208 RepID=A0A4Z0PN51_9BACT|nr:universal stress protein [Hymenobacter elongatus]TGE17394.1 universal stress protein [Hymenobacter elongatus]
MNPSIVVLANLSEAAEKTARYAAVLGAPLHAHVALLHCYHDPVLLAPEMAVVTAAQAERNYTETAAEMQNLAQQLSGSTEVMVSVLPMPDAVAEAVQQYQPLLLAMGLSPKHDLLDALLHNQVLPVLRATHQPLLLVPEAAPAAVLPRRVLLALDAEPFSLNAAGNKLVPLLAAWQAAYTVTHVVLHHEAAAPRGRLPLADVRASGLLAPDAPLWLYQEADVAPADGILQALADTQADLLVLIARHRSFLGRLFHHSVTAEVLRRSPVPVLLVPAEAPEAPEAPEVPGWMPTMS